MNREEWKEWAICTWLVLRWVLLGAAGMTGYFLYLQYGSAKTDDLIVALVALAGGALVGYGIVELIRIEHRMRQRKRDREETDRQWNDYMRQHDERVREQVKGPQ